ncbi:MAG TPA: NUDIX hydrolase [Pyrinomonadaceae bacterium]|nr:NUDIX hydrolase [Pyrinomonadaceae bacterium]
MTEIGRKQNLPTFEQISAGGVVYRRTNAELEIVVIQVVPELRWQLPKGVIDPGETSEQAALREVREESGIEAELHELIHTSEYWFTVDRGGERWLCHKFVDYYLMEYRAGDVADHDHEVTEARWVTVATALEMLFFQSDRDIVSKAVTMIKL